MLQGITIEDLLSTLETYGLIILQLALLYLIMRISSALFVWFVRTLIIPIWEKRSYFYTYNSEGTFYSESKILGLFRLGRNYRCLINDTLVGYVATRRGQKNESPGANKIYLRKKGREFVGEAKSKYEKDGTWVSFTNNQGEVVCNIYLTNPEEEGGYEVNPEPVGYVDGTGRVYKYYACREDWMKGEKLDVPEFIGQCETPSATKGKHDKTNGEHNHADVLQYIKWKANESNLHHSDNDNIDYSEVRLIDERRTYLDKNQVFQMDDCWFFFRRNWPFFKKVTSKEMIGGGAVKDGKRFPYAFLSSKLWRILHVYPIGWPCKAKAWGYGYCTEDFRNPFTEKDDEIPMITRAGAALLLARKEGFYIDPDEVISDGVPGAAATALLSLFVYLLLFPILISLSSYTLFPFLGTEYSSVTTLVGLFLSIWLILINPIRCLIRYNHDWLEAFLEMLNKNVGVLGWMSTLIISVVIGLLGSYFLYGIDYYFFPMFLSALIAISVNWLFYHQQPWAISNIYEDFKFEESKDEEREKQQEECERISHSVKVNLPTKTIIFDETILFDSDKLKDLRSENPFRETLTSSYESTVKEMIRKEFSAEVYSKILSLSSKISDYVNRYHLSNVEKVKLILKICQPNNIVYCHDWNSEELLLQSDNLSLLKNRDEGKEGKGFIEYCRFPTETIHDKRGDCDCHAAFGAALLAACGFRSCFAIGNVSSEDTKADHAMCGIENVPELKAYQRPDNSFEKDGRTFIILEVTGQYDIEEIMDFQRKMAQENQSVIIEPIEPYKKQ